AVRSTVDSRPVALRRTLSRLLVHLLHSFAYGISFRLRQNIPRTHMSRSKSTGNDEASSLGDELGPKPRGRPSGASGIGTEHGKVTIELIYQFIASVGHSETRPFD